MMTWANGKPEHPAHQIRRELDSAMEHLRVRCAGHARHTNDDARDHVGAALLLIDEIFKWEHRYLKQDESSEKGKP